MMYDTYCTTGGDNRPPMMPQPAPIRRDEGLVQALQMLLRSGLSGLVDFQAMAFVSDTFLVGSTIIQPLIAESYDNLADTLTASFSGFTPCACEYLDVAGTLYLPAGPGTDTGITVSRIALDDVHAVAFGTAGDADYQSARALMSRILHPDACRDACPPYPDPCCEPCDVNSPAVGRTVALVLGAVVIVGAVVLGKIGNVLVLANDTDQRFYFVQEDYARIVR